MEGTKSQDGGWRQAERENENKDALMKQKTQKKSFRAMCGEGDAHHKVMKEMSIWGSLVPKAFGNSYTSFCAIFRVLLLLS